MLACAVALVPTALAGNGGIAPPDSATDSGSAINDLYWFLFAISAVVFLIVEGALIWFIFRFRRRRGAAYDAEGPQLHGNSRLEVAWTAIPVMIVIAIAVVTFIKVGDVNATPDEGEEAITVQVQAHQFYWQYVYPNGAISLDVLRVPVDRTIRLELTSPDVVHSWWVPELTGKRDAIPGRKNVLHFKVRREGSFRGQCAELCGVQHAVMYTQVEVIGEDDYDSWVEREAAAQSGTGGESELGARTYEAVCAKCHGFEGEGGIGPAIVGKVTTREGLVRLLNEGQDTELEEFMPPVGLGWPDRQVDALLEHLTTDPTLSGGVNGG